MTLNKGPLERWFEGIRHNCFHVNSELCQREFCKALEDVFKKAAYGNSLNGLPHEDIVDILSDSNEAVLNSIGEFRGNTPTQFKGWVRAIVRHKRDDYLRKKYPREEKEIELRDNGDETDKLGDITDVAEQILLNISVEKLISILKTMVLQGKTECVQIILDYYEGLKRGLSQKEMAEERGEIPNTFNQRLKRCLKKIRDILKKDFSQFWRETKEAYF